MSDYYEKESAPCMLVGELMYDCDQYKARNETCGDAILAAILALHNKSHQGSL